MYGEPAMDDKLQAEAEAGRVHFGGCDISFDDPNRHCNDCENNFNTKAPGSIDEMLKDG